MKIDIEGDKLCQSPWLNIGFLIFENIWEFSSLHLTLTALPHPSIPISSSCWGPSIEAHMRAIKTIVIFLALFIMYYVVFLIVTSRFLNPHGKLELMFGGLTAVIFPMSHSFILLMGSSKLREAFLKVRGIVKGFHKRRKYSVPQRILKEAERNQQKCLSLLSVVCIPFLLCAIGNHSYLPLF